MLRGLSYSTEEEKVNDFDIKVYSYYQNKYLYSSVCTKTFDVIVYISLVYFYSEDIILPCATFLFFVFFLFSLNPRDVFLLVDQILEALKMPI